LTRDGQGLDGSDDLWVILGPCMRSGWVEMRRTFASSADYLQRTLQTASGPLAFPRGNFAPRAFQAVVKR
jgi:hypothetical protein